MSRAPAAGSRVAEIKMSRAPAAGTRVAEIKMSRVPAAGSRVAEIKMSRVPAAGSRVAEIKPRPGQSPPPSPDRAAGRGLGNLHLRVPPGLPIGIRLTSTWGPAGRGEPWGAVSHAGTTTQTPRGLP